MNKNYFKYPQNKDLIYQELDPKLVQEFDELASKMNTGYFNWISSIIFALIMILGVIVIKTIKASAMGESLIDILKRSWFLYAIVVFLIIISFIIYLMIKHKHNKELKELLQRFSELMKRIDSFYNIPSDKTLVDILTCDTSDFEDDSEPDINEYDLENSACFKDSTYLYINTIKYLVRIPLSASFTITDVNENYVSLFWNKQDSYNDSKYSSFVRKEKHGSYIFKYCLVKVILEDEVNEFYLPIYEKEVIEKLINK